MTGKWCYRVQSFDQNDVIITNICQNQKFLQNFKIRISQIQQKGMGGWGWEGGMTTFTLTCTCTKDPTETWKAGRHIPVPHMRRVWSWGLMKQMVEILLCRWLPLAKVLVRVPFSQSHILKLSPSCSHFSHFLFFYADDQGNYGAKNWPTLPNKVLVWAQSHILKLSPSCSHFSHSLFFYAND